jgi:AcrR family transcriptional regulator
MDKVASDSGWRGSADVWLDAAYEMLLESGVEAVKILPLAQKLNLSRTSFYWFFKDRSELLAALLAQWREKNTGNLIKLANAYSDSLVEAVLNVSDAWFDSGLFDSRFEFAVRSWALQSSEVLAEVQAADQQRLEALRAMYMRFGYPELAADVRARTMYLVQIGYISMQTKEDLALRLSRLPQYVEVFANTVPQKHEMDRFMARHRPREEDT